MAGYIIALNNVDALQKCITEGVYSTNFKDLKNNYWKTHHEGTFADYLGMKEGDNIYFFIKRKIYGIGELINIKNDCKYLNYPEADIPKVIDKEEIAKNILVKNYSDNSSNFRCICCFKPSPNFFMQGIDMDDALASNPHKFKVLRAFWKVSFIKIDDEENKALKDIILKRNENSINKQIDNFMFDNNIHLEITKKINENYKLNSKNIIKYCREDEKLKHEMAIEAALIEKLTKGTEEIFGQWDYISHQVIASPFKPIDYMDKIDVFGYRYIKGFDTISKYLIIEIKKDKAGREALKQVMKYVDWVNQEYAFDDYSMINAFLVASDFDDDLLEYKKEVCIRNYIKGRRPVTLESWNNLRLIKYKVVNDNLEFEEIK